MQHKLCSKMGGGLKSLPPVAETFRFLCIHSNWSVVTYRDDYKAPQVGFYKTHIWVRQKPALRPISQKFGELYFLV